MKITEKLYVTDRDDWRAWLRKNHDSKSEVWVIFYKTHAGKPVISYNDAVEEALCFGWIDSIIQKIDEEKFARKFTPRKDKSRWSETNKRTARKMIKQGRMTEAGLARIRAAKKSGEWFRPAPTKKELILPSYIKEALAANEKALENFSKLASTYKRHFVGWVTSAKREETRQRRLAQAIRLLKQNKKLGLK